MVINLKTKEDIAILREGGKRHAAIMKELVSAVRVGMKAIELDALASRLIKEGGDKPAFLGYRPDGAERDYPATLCVSINEEIVHGIPNEGEKILRDGDIVGIDLGLIHGGRFTDMAVTVAVGNVDEVGKELIQATKEALEIGIKAVQAGGHVGDIGAAIEKFVRPTGFSLAKDLAGHGVGFAVHEDPYIPNTGKVGKGDLLEPGMVIAIEPMLCVGKGDIKLLDDGYTYVTKDGKRSAHFEHTVLVTETGGEILTKM